MEFCVPSPTSEHLSEHIIVRAGAGAGKTRRLTEQVIGYARDFYSREKRYPRMVVTTFTRKATQELRERLMLRVMGDDHDLLEFINSRSFLLVSTIHGVLDVFLKRYGSRIGLDPGFKILSERDLDRVARQTLRSLVVESVSAQGLLETFGFDRLLEILRQLDELTAQNPTVSPETSETLSILFQQRLQGLMSELINVADTIESESEKTDWLEMAREFRQVAQSLAEVDWAKKRELVLQKISLIKSARYTSKNPPVSEETSETAKELLKKLRELEDEIYDPKEWERLSLALSEIQKLSDVFSVRFREMKMQQGMIEISDLELLAMRLLREDPEAAQSFSQEWDYWLIDEYQDTSPFQVELLRHLTGGRSSFLVGDPQQSIYLFRGARSEVFALREKEILAARGQRDVLETNYRSQPELLMFLNDFFGKLKIPFKPMKPSQPVSDPNACVATFAFFQKPEGEDTETSAEIQALVAYVHRLLNAGAAPEDICVLGRTNQILIDVAAALHQSHLPTHVHSASGFFSRRETRDALVFLKFLVNPHDNRNLIELLRSPWFRVPDETLVSVVEGRLNSHWRSLCQAMRADADEFEAIRRLQVYLEQREEFGVAEVFARALRESGFIDLSHQHDASGRRESNIFKLLTNLRDQEVRAGFNYLDFVDNAERDLSESSGAEESDAIAAVEPNRINLMTIHAAKGLQFKHVIVPRVTQRPRLTISLNFVFDELRGRWSVRTPDLKTGQSKGHLAEKNWLEVFREQEIAEHARVLYVALTRATHTVYLSGEGEPAANSWAEMMRFDLSSGAHQTPHYRYLVENEISAHEQKEESKDQTTMVRPVFQPAMASHGLQNTSVTALLDQNLKRERVGDLDVVRRVRVASEGTAIHRLMEALQNAEANTIQSMARRWFPDQEERIADVLNYAQNLKEPPLLEIIRNGEVEWGFAFAREGLLIEGQIDLWGRVRSDQGDVVWVVDYKTGRIDAAEKAFQQLALYADALRAGGYIRNGDQVRLAAVFLFSKKVFVRT